MIKLKKARLRAYFFSDYKKSRGCASATVVVISVFTHNNLLPC